MLLEQLQRPGPEALMQCQQGFIDTQLVDHRLPLRLVYPENPGPGIAWPPVGVSRKCSRMLESCARIDQIDDGTGV
ncbi:MAG: hypothetical protein M3437_00780, partial [Chloroflexota bacterium]|nr:hypothetical protein [Chloroflexota bacterium]